MVKLKLLFILLFTVFSTAVSAQVKIRLFSNQFPESAVFSVTEGRYELNMFNGEIFTIWKGEPVIISKYNGKLAVKKRNTEGFVCDSIVISGKREMMYFPSELMEIHR